MKGELLDHRMQFDLAGYYTTSHDPYFFVFLAINSTRNLGNIGEVTYKGIDFSGTALLTDRLQLDLGYGYTDSDITHDADPTVIGNQAPAAHLRPGRHLHLLGGLMTANSTTRRGTAHVR